MRQNENWRRIPLIGYYDNRTPKNNPHKGWYLHYYDNCLDVYHDKENPDDYLLDFPNFNHVYLRLGWAYLEPEEGKYNWDLLDDVIKRWWAHDRRAAFRICTKETGPDQAYMVPKWVVDAGCKGEMTGFGGGPKTNFEPDYGDPVFLEKFNNFMKALGERYDGAPFLEYIDIGSMGEWGECHTEGTTERVWPVEVMKEHIDMHTRHFKKTPVLYNYDMSALRRTHDGTEEELLNYAVQKGCGVRADSCCVNFYEDRYGVSSMHEPETFQPFYNVGPMDLEFGHYGGIKNKEPWGHGFPGIASAYETYATFAGFHGYAREFLADHPAYTLKLGHLLGYWYFPKTAYLPTKVRAGQRVSMAISWENRGVSPCFYKYELYAKLRKKAAVPLSEGSGSGIDPCCSGGGLGAEPPLEQCGEVALLHLEECNNRKWEPKLVYDEIYSIRPPANLTSGEYELSIGLFEPNPENPKIPSGYTAPKPYPFPGRPIGIGLKESLRDEDGFYRIGAVEISPFENIPYEGVVNVEPLWPGHPKSQD